MSTRRLTHIAWDISAARYAARFRSAPVRLLNDLEAMANSVDVLTRSELLVLQEGCRRKMGMPS